MILLSLTARDEFARGELISSVDNLILPSALRPSPDPLPEGEGKTDTLTSASSYSAYSVSRYLSFVVCGGVGLAGNSLPPTCARPSTARAGAILQLSVAKKSWR